MDIPYCENTCSTLIQVQLVSTDTDVELSTYLVFRNLVEELRPHQM
jgi:hypothetical protein